MSPHQLSTHNNDTNNTHLYRPNVGIALFCQKGLVFAGRRTDAPESPCWQMPQGGIDNGESPRQAAYRELAEETGIQRQQTRYLDQIDTWFYYDFPPEVRERLGGPYRGQRQRWFALAFVGEDSDIVLDNGRGAEFDDWTWMSLSELARLIVPFKRTVYHNVWVGFARYCAGLEGASDWSGKAMA